MERKTIAIFGATGRTGIPLVEQALQEGYTVKALVRNKNKLPAQWEGKVNVIEGFC